jgi:Doubled CXXCH motif (Paired_CXXCH_1)
MTRKLTICFALLAAVSFPLLAGEWHAGATNVCTDCHTMHFSMQHNWDGTTPVPTVPTNVTTAGTSGNWLGASGPNMRLLKAPVNTLCLTCHDGQTFAPDVLAVNTNSGAGVTTGRGAGALNEPTSGAPYDTYKGHTLGNTSTPPGFNPVGAGVPATSVYVPANGLECTSCHLQHGSATVYRNLGPRSAAFQPTYVISTTNDITKDVWVNLASYTAGSGTSATFNPYYDASNIAYNRTDPAKPAGALMQTSNRLDTFCSSCHGDFHGGPTDANIGSSVSGVGAQDFIRHPTSIQVIGLAANGGQSSLTRYAQAAATTKVKVYTTDYVGYTNATPGCVTCHKAHGNQNPFGLIFLNGASTSGYGSGDAYESGGMATGEVENLSGYGRGYRNLCGQCHGQGAGLVAPW